MREHDPASEMPLIHIADLAPHRFKQWREIRHFGQCGDEDDFGTLLNFAVWMLYFVDYEHDGLVIDRVAENALCEPVGLGDFETYVGGTASLLKSPPPDFLVVPQAFSVAIQVYQGWIDKPHTRYNIRSTLVWASGKRLMALHTRYEV